MNNVSVRLVFDRKHVATKKHQSSVQLEITFQRQRKYIGTGVKLYSDQWGKDSQVKNHPQSIQLNKKLAQLITDIYEFQNTLVSKKLPFSFERLEAYLKDAFDSDEDSFLVFMKKRIESRHVSESTKARQRCVLKALSEFGKIKKFNDLCPKVIKEYDDFAWSRCQLQSSVYNYHKILKTFVREAYALQYIQFNPYATFKLSKGETGYRKFLTKEELNVIEKKTIENESLQRVRDLFLFCCFTDLLQ